MKRHKGQKKTESQRIHFSRRCIDRFGFCPSLDERKAVVDLIQSGGAIFVEKQSNRVSVFQVVMRGMKMNVVYDKQRKALVTAMYTEDSPIFEGGLGDDIENDYLCGL